MKTILDIFIVAYQRPEVLLHTLKHLYNNITESKTITFNLYVWINDSTDEDTGICIWALLHKPYFIENLKFFPADSNYGKAHALNVMFENHSAPDHFVLAMDQDMVFKMPFVPIIEQAIKINADILGFASKNYYPHIPNKNILVPINFVDFDLYYSMFVAGGIMLLPGSFLADHKWTNEDGVYGGDDYNMCMETESKFVLEWDVDWLDHDPLGPQLNSLNDYYAKKNAYTSKGQFVLPAGWYKE